MYSIERQDDNVMEQVLTLFHHMFVVFISGDQVSEVFHKFSHVFEFSNILIRFLRFFHNFSRIFKVFISGDQVIEATRRSSEKKCRVLQEERFAALQNTAEQHCKL